MFKIAVCDDDRKILQMLNEILIKEYGEIIQVVCIDDMEEYINKLQTGRETYPDIVIADIKWEDEAKNGIEYMEVLQQINPGLKVLFLTGYIKYAEDIFRVNPSSFLLKPIQEARLKEAVDKVMNEINRERSRKLVLSIGSELIILNPTDIYYIESSDHELHVTGKDECIRLRMKLDDCLRRLPSSFIRIHKSFAVNAAYINKISMNAVRIQTGKELPVSRRRYRASKEQFLRYLGE